MVKKIEKIKKIQEGAQAIPPDPPAFIKQAIEDTKETEEPKETDDRVLASGADTDFWRLVKGFIERNIDGFKERTTQTVMASGFNLEEAGLRYTLTDQLAHFGRDIIKYVENRRKAVERMKKDEAERRGAKK